VEELSGAGPVLGILGSIEYAEYRTHLDEGDTLVIYSDGVTEAANPEGEEFDTERLGAAVQRSRTEPAGAIVEAVNRAVADFTAGAPQSDDITLIVARRAGSGATA
jgi:sigma-B regulation protein RsbU (phosphoserine phosphatase)